MVTFFSIGSVRDKFLPLFFKPSIHQSWESLWSAPKNELRKVCRYSIWNFVQKKLGRWKKKCPIVALEMICLESHVAIFASWILHVFKVVLIRLQQSRKKNWSEVTYSVDEKNLWIKEISSTILSISYCFFQKPIFSPSLVRRP